MLEDLKETIARAVEIKNLNALPFVTIWKTGKLFGFNFDEKPIGYETKEYGINRVVVGVY